MIDISEAYNAINANIVSNNNSKIAKIKKNDRMLQLVAVSKGQTPAKIRELLEIGHFVFGENKIQEAKLKWLELKEDYPEIELHFIGSLQSNKVAEAVALFDVIETIDRPKIALNILKEMQKQEKNPTCFIQVNIGEEPQKSGVMSKDLRVLLNYCKEIGLNIAGLMCVPPHDKPSAPYFALLQKLSHQHGLEYLSMGMSNDYQSAMKFGATHIRVGTMLFGERGVV